MFITFEGIDFCGKSTQVKLLKQYLEKQNNKVDIIREPGGTGLSEKIREILLDKNNIDMTSEAEIFLFSAARAQLVREVIEKKLDEGYFVISDRFFDSTTAYQGHGRGLDLESVSYINKLAVGDTLPDITFLIDIPVEELERRKTEQALLILDRIELSEKNFYNDVRNGYLKIAHADDRFKVIDGTLTIDEIHSIIIKEIENVRKKNIQI